jgi:dihydroorotase
MATDTLDVATRGPPLLLRGGRVIDPAQQRDETADVLLRDGRVVDVGPSLGVPDDARVIDVAGLVVAPGPHRPARASA